MSRLTIYTPTYNRAYILPKVYESLCAQDCKEFVWMIVDDGSTDQTGELVSRWIKENKIQINYYYKENGGVHTARDYAFHHAETELITGCDSDDYLTKDAVGKWLELWDQRDNKTYAGIISVTINENGDRITDRFPPMSFVSYQEYTYKYHCYKEKDAVFNLSVAKRLLDYPVFPNEKLVGEGYKWIQYSENTPFLLLDYPTRIYCQQEDGYIKNVKKSRKNNPNGFRAMYQQYIIHGKSIKPILKGQIGYIAYSLLLEDKHFVRNSPKPLQTVLCIPLGLLYYIKMK